MSTRVLAAAIILATSASLVAPPLRAQAVTPVASFAPQTVDVPVELFRSNRMFVTGSINGIATDMMVDSGAGMTVLDTRFAKKLGLKLGDAVPVEGAGGSVPGHIVKNVRVAVGSLSLDRTDVLVIDLSAVERAIGRSIPMVLGHDAFAASLVTIDFPRKVMRFQPRGSFAAPANAVRLPLGTDGGLRTVEIGVGEGKPIKATFDLGNGGTVLLSRKLRDERPDLASLPYAVGQMGGVGGLKPARRVTLPSVTFAGQRFTNVPATINEDAKALPDDGANVGLEMLKPFVVHIDFTGNSMTLVPSTERVAFPKDRAGFRSELVDGRLKVVFVTPTSPAAKAGLRAGDEVVSINGAPVGADYYRLAADQWSFGPVGTPVELSRADGSRLRLVLADYF